MGLFGKAFALVLVQSVLLASPCFPEAILVDHSNTDLSLIPDSWIETVKTNIKVYYGHTSHGQQLVTGLEMIKSAFGKKYDVFVYSRSLPNVERALSVRNTSDTYNPEDFFETVDAAIAKDQKINVVMYGWCSQPNGGNWKILLRKYTARMNEFEKRYPNITFVYMTAHAQRRDCEGCNRHQFNEGLRKYCKDNGKVLFDFGDIDAWYGETMNSYISPSWCECAGKSLPVEHARFGGGSGEGPCAHTNAESCTTKGRAAWWLLARIAGWNPSVRKSEVVPSRISMGK